MSRSPLSRYATAGRIAPLALAITACASPPPPVPSPAPTAEAGVLQYPHWDQVCRETRASVEPIRVSEIFDTAGLGVAVLAVLPRDLPPIVDRPAVDFVSHYHADGRVEVAGLWDETVDSTTADAVAALLAGRTRATGTLLGPTSFHSRLTLRPTPRLGLRPAVDCMPHIAHEEGQPPTGLPDRARLTTGSGIRPGVDATSQVRITLGRAGEVVAVERRGGYQSTFEEAETVVRGLTFGPALSNGRPVEGSIVQTVAFRQPRDTSKVGLDSVYLVRHGFDRRASSFDALLRVGPREMTRGESLAQRLSSLPRVELRGGARDPQLFIAGASCPAQTIVNGYVPPGDEARPMDPGPPPEKHWLGDDPAVMSQISGIELYAPGSPVVADPDRCGTLLIWSRNLTDDRRTTILGRVDGTLPPGDRSSRREVMADPGGFRTFVTPNGDFRFYGLHPGRYDLVAREGDRVIATGSVVVTAFEAVEVGLGR